MQQQPQDQQQAGVEPMEALVRQFSWILPDLISVLSEIEASTGSGSSGSDGGAGGGSGSSAGAGGASAASASALQTTSKQLLAFKQRLLQLSASVQALPGIDLSEQQQVELHAKLTQKLQTKLDQLESYRQLALLQLANKPVSNASNPAMPQGE